MWLGIFKTYKFVQLYQGGVVRHAQNDNKSAISQK